VSIVAIVIATAALIVAFATRKGVMDNIDRLRGLVTRLNETITTEATQQKAVIEKLRAELAAGNSEEAKAALDELEASIERVKAIVPDEPAAEGVAEPAGEAPIES